MKVWERSQGKGRGEGEGRCEITEIIVSERTEALNISGWEQGESGFGLM